MLTKLAFVETETNYNNKKPENIGQSQSGEESKNEGLSLEDMYSVYR